MVVKSNNKLNAENRRKILDLNLKAIKGIDTISSEEIFLKFGLKFPSAHAVSLSNTELNIAICSKDKLEAKVNYELETWAFALLSKLNSNITNINFYIRLHFDYKNLLNEKWFDLFLKRISFLNEHKEINVKLNLYHFNDNCEKLTTIRIPSWKEVEEEIDIDNIYTPLDIENRGDRSERNEEDKEQNRIIRQLSLKSSNSLVQKEFTYAHKKLGKLRNRIDILHADNKNIDIIEVKIKAELDVISQILDYYIFVLTHISYFELKGWDSIKLNKNIRSLILCTNKHPMLDATADIYKKFGFINLEIYKNINGHYGDYI